MLSLIIPSLDFFEVLSWSVILTICTPAWYREWFLVVCEPSLALSRLEGLLISRPYDLLWGSLLSF